MKLFKNFFITIRTKGFIAAFLAIKSFFIILLVNIFSSSAFIKRKIFNFKMYLNPRDNGISRTLLLYGEREQDHKIILEKVLKKNMKIFDIGANIGFYVLMESKLIGDNGKIVAVEPVPENLELLKKNLELNNNKITKTIQVGLSDQSEEKKNFFLSDHSNLGSLIQLNNSINLKNVKKIKIKTLSLKKLISKTFVPDFIRMDIEGHEVSVLNSLSKLKLKKYPIICFETHKSKYTKKNSMKSVLKKLFKIGYKVKLSSTSSQLGSKRVDKLGYRSLYSNIKTDDVIRNIYKDLKDEDAINLICNFGGLRTILLENNNEEK